MLMCASADFETLLRRHQIMGLPTTAAAVALRQGYHSATEVAAHFCRLMAVSSYPQSRTVKCVAAQPAYQRASLDHHQVSNLLHVAPAWHNYVSSHLL